jgi:hypothetical protein
LLELSANVYRGLSAHCLLVRLGREKVKPMGIVGGLLLGYYKFIATGPPKERRGRNVASYIAATRLWAFICIHFLGTIYKLASEFIPIT